MTKKTTLLITAPPDSQKAWQALRTAQDHLQAGDDISVFFYGDGAYTANAFRWQTADVPDVAAAWADLHKIHGLALPVCVSTALARGITDPENAKRHHLTGDNLKPPFYLAGLSELAMMVTDSQLIQY